MKIPPELGSSGSASSTWRPRRRSPGQRIHRTSHRRISGCFLRPGGTVFFTPVLDACIDNGIIMAFENCPMDGDRESGDWNIAFAPEFWDVIFGELLVDSHCGLEFDPSHCFGLHQEPVALAETWAHKIVHAHGKDSLSPPESGFCFPGEGMSDWKSLYEILNTRSRSSAIDIEGYHREFVGHQQEMALQQRALQYLKNVRDLLN